MADTNKLCQHLLTRGRKITVSSTISPLRAECHCWVAKQGCHTEGTRGQPNPRYLLTRIFYQVSFQVLRGRVLLFIRSLKLVKKHLKFCFLSLPHFSKCWDNSLYSHLKEHHWHCRMTWIGEGVASLHSLLSQKDVTKVGDPAHAFNFTWWSYTHCFCSQTPSCSRATFSCSTLLFSCAVVTFSRRWLMHELQQN